MLFLSHLFYFFVIGLLVVYYCIPTKYRWIILLLGSLGIYTYISRKGIILLLFAAAVSYLCGLLLEKWRENDKKATYRKWILGGGIILAAAPLLCLKIGELFLKRITEWNGYELFAVLGISYFTLQVIGYMVDVYRGTVTAQKNIAKYLLFVTFFPQMVQGPIARYNQLGNQFFEHTGFCERLFAKGFQRILFGFFLKFMIADKAGIVVDTLFTNWRLYEGSYVWVAGILYSIQIYTDFMACIYIVRGIASLFGIELADNFKQPYFSGSIKEFWGRWHISLSHWLRDYIYIPLGGNRKGIIRKWCNLIVVFLVSGLWHGNGLTFLAWGMMHAVYQIAGEATLKIRGKIRSALKIRDSELLSSLLHKGFTFLEVMVAWIVFRAESLQCAISMIRSMFTVCNPWIFFDDSLFRLGLDIKEMILLMASVVVLFVVSYKKHKDKVRLGDWFQEQHIIFRVGVYMAAIIVIVMFGTYGYGFNSQDFIYGGF